MAICGRLHSRLNILIVVVGALCAYGRIRGQGGPPMITDDPETPPPGHWEDNIGAILAVNRDSTQEMELPQVDLNFGLTDHLYIKYEVAWLANRDPGSRTKAGLGDSTFGFKWRFLDGEKSCISAATYPKLQLNSGPNSYRRGIVDHNSSVQIPFECEKKIGDGLQADIEVGYTAHARHASGADYWNAGFLLVREMNSKLTAMAETNATLSRTWSRNSAVVNIGANCSLNKVSALIASIGTGIAGAGRPKFIAYFGTQITY